MLLVKLDVLKALASVNEADEQVDFSYQEFLDEYERVFKETGKSLDVTYIKIRSGYLKRKCPPIQFINEGSSRAAYACQGGICLKIAMNEKGLAQNRQEAQTIKNSPYSCFTKMYVHDNGFKSLMTECCSSLNFKIVRNTWKFNFRRVIEIMETIVDYFECDAEKAMNECHSKLKEKKERNVDEHSWGFIDLQEHYELMRSIVQDKNPAFQVLRDLLLFYKENGKESLDFADLWNDENWGLAIREGKIVPVIVDAGLSVEIYDKYYA